MLFVVKKKKQKKRETFVLCFHNEGEQTYKFVAV